MVDDDPKDPQYNFTDESKDLAEGLARGIRTLTTDLAVFEATAIKLVESNKILAEDLIKNRTIGVGIEKELTGRFHSQKRWNFIFLSVSLALLAILLFFTVAFFHYAIIVRE